MGEASKTMRRHGERLRPFLTGRGIDIGAGEDLVSPNARPFDRDHGDAERIDEVIHDTFDFVWSSHCLEHLTNPPDALRRWWSLVRPGGYLILVVPDVDLYEQGSFPSRVNPEHRHAFSVAPHARVAEAIVVPELVEPLGGEIVLLEQQSDGLDRSLLLPPGAEPDPLEVVAWTLVSAALRAFRAPIRWRIRAARRRGRLVDQTVLEDDRLAQILLVVRKPADP